MQLVEQFISFLKEQKRKPSKATIKNYKADVGQFIRWFEERFKNSFDPNKATSQVVDPYKESQSFSANSMERHLSSLRKFFNFLKLEGLISQSPFEQSAMNHEPKTIDPYRIKDFKDFLYVYNASHLTIKNYIIDIKQFFKWAEEVTDSKNEWDINKKNVLAKIDSSFVEEYKNRLLEQEFLPSTVNRKLSSLRKYFNWAQAEGLLSSRHAEFISASQVKTRSRNEFGMTDNQVQNDKLALQGLPSSSLSGLGVEDLQPQYSKIPPVRLAQKFANVFELVFDYLVVFPLAKLGETFEYTFWQIKGKPVFKPARSPLAGSSSFHFPSSKSTFDPLSSIVKKVSNIKKSFYAPLSISTKSFPWHRKAWHHLRHTRPKWYRTYHSYPITHYFHLAILIIFMTAVGFALYNAFATTPKSQSPAFAAPVAPPRILSFQGRLTDSSDNPVTAAATAMRMAIYNDPTASGAALLWQEIVSVSPDTDGIFSILLGNNTAITQSIFAQNATLYLGVTVGSTAELTPRQQLATVAFATNAEVLQGLPPVTDAGVTTNTNAVLALNSSGTVSIAGTATTTFQAASGQLTITGKPLVLQTNSGTGGNITFAPDGLGTIDLQKPIQNSSNNNNISTAVGAVEIDDLMAILATSSGQSALTINQTSTGPLISASTSGTAKFTVDSSGNVGIGTATASYPLDVVGSARLTNLSANAYLYFQGSDGTASIRFNANNHLATDGRLGVGGNFYTLGIYQYNSGQNIIDFSDDATTIIKSSATNNGDIQFIPNGTGTIDIQKAIRNTTANNGGAVYVNDTFAASGNVGIGTTAPGAALDVRGLSGTLPAATISATSSFAALITDNSGVGDLFTASKSGATKFVITNAGNVGIGTNLPAATLDVSGTLKVSGTTNFGSIAYTWPGSQTTNYVLQTNGSGTLSWVDANAAAASTIYWNQASGLLYPKNSTVDLTIGGQSTASAKFAFINVNSGNPTASISGNLSLAVPTAAGANTFNLLNNSTLNFQRSPGGDAGLAANSVLYLNNNGNVGIGTTTPGYALDIVGNSALWQSVYGTDDGLVLSLPFSEGTGTKSYDRSPYGNDGTITGASWSTGKYGNAISFDGTADYVTVSDSPTLQITGSLTISLWLYANSFTAGQNMGVMDKTTGQPGYQLYLGDTGGATRRLILDTSGRTAGNETVTINSGQWYHIVVTSDTSFEKYYVDGVLKQSIATDGNPITAGTNNLLIGDLDSAASWYFNGKMDEIRIYNRTLSADEVKAQYLGGLKTNTAVAMNTSTTAQTLYGLRGILTNTGIVTTGTDTNYGSRIDVTRTGATGGTINTYGQYIALTADNAGAGTSNSYGLYVDTSGSTADNNYSAYFSGRVGIGTTAPLAALDVRGLSGTLPAATVSATSSFASLIVDNAGVGDLFTASKSGATKFVITNAGNVGIGTNTPGALLHIYNPTDATGVQKETLRSQGKYIAPGSGSLIRFTNYNAGGTNPNALEYNLSGISGYDYDGNWGGALAFFTAPTGTTGGANLAQRMTIIENGNVGIGITAPTSLLYVKDPRTSGTNPGLQVEMSGTAYSGQAAIAASVPGGSAGSNYALLVEEGVGTSIGTVTTGGSGNFLVKTLFAKDGCGAGCGGSLRLQSNRDITLMPGSGGYVGIGTTSPLATLDLRGNLGTGPIASFSGRTSFAGLVVDNGLLTTDLGDLITASSSAYPGQTPSGGGDSRTQFRVTNQGSVYARSFYDIDNSAYFLDPAASNGTALSLAGNISIGTTAPGATVDVQSSGGVFGTNLKDILRLVNNDTAAANNGVNIEFSALRTGGQITPAASISAIMTNIGSTTYTGALAFSTAGTAAIPTERMRIDGSGNVGIATASAYEKLEVYGGNILVDRGHFKFNRENPPADTITYADSGIAGNLNGTYSYGVSFVTANGESGGTSSGVGVAVINKKMNVSNIPIGSAAVTARKIYRTDGGAGNPRKYVATISDNTTTTYTDNLADAGLGAAISAQDSTAGSFYINGALAFYPGETNSYNFWAGLNAGLNSTGMATFNTGVGVSALKANTSGSSSTAVGALALTSNTTGANDAFGFRTLYSNSTGGSNVGLGSQALYRNDTGTHNIGIGANAEFGNNNGHRNTIIGSNAFVNGNNSHSDNIGIGYIVGDLVTTGSRNVLIGSNVATTMTTGSDNILIGYNVQPPAVDSTYKLNIGGTIYGDLSTKLIGIGNATPLTALDVTGSASLSANFSLRGAGTAHTFNILDNGTLNFATSVGGDAVTNSTLFIKNGGASTAGSVGIGTTSPLATLDLRGNLGTGPIASFSGRTSFAGLVVDNGLFTTDLGDLITASSSAYPGQTPSGGGDSRTQFRVTNQGSVYGRAFYDIDNSAYFLDPANTGTALAVNGSVGIGVTNPSTTLQVYKANASGVGPVLSLASDGGSGTTTAINFSPWLARSGGASAAIIGQDDGNFSGNLLFQTAPTGNQANTLTTRMIVNSSGNVGIGTTTPLATLDIRGNSGTVPAASISATSSFAALITDNSGVGDLFTASKSGATKFVITNAGNVGIGTNTPGAALAVSGGNNINERFPDGLIATPVNTSVTTDADGSPATTYTVTTGKTFYITNSYTNSAGCNLQVGSKSYTTGAGIHSFGAPLLAGSGVQVQASTGANCTHNVNGFEVAAGVTAKNQSLTTDIDGIATTTYTVTTGKTFYITNYYANLASCRLTVGGKAYTTTVGSSSFTSPLLAGSGVEVSAAGAASCTGNVNGYETKSTGLGGADVAEQYFVVGNGDPGDIISMDSLSSSSFPAVSKTSKSYDRKVMGVITTNPGITLADDTTRNSDKPTVAVALNGRVPVKVSLENGPIQVGDPLTSSSIPGVAMRATKAGPIVAKALEPFDGSSSSQVSSQLVSGTNELTNNQLTNHQTGKIMAFVNVSWYDPDVYITSTGNYSLAPTDLALQGETLQPQSPSPFVLKDPFENIIDRIGAFAEIAVANLKAGFISAQEITTNSLAVTADSVTIGGQTLRAYIASIVTETLNSQFSTLNSQFVSPIASIDSLKTNFISPLASDSAIALSLDSSKLIVHSSNDASSSAVATIDNQGNASFAGTLRAKKIIADQIEGLNIQTSTLSAQYITNNYFASPSAEEQSSNLAMEQFINISSYSAQLAHIENLNAAFATFTQGLIALGPTSLNDVSVAGQLSIGTSLILADNSINVLGQDLGVQPLRQGGISFLSGLVHIDADGNLKVGGNAEFAKDVTVKGVLSANIISPIPGSDLIVRLNNESGIMNQATDSASIHNSQFIIHNSSGSAVLTINQQGDIASSGSATFGKLNLGLVQPALAISNTELLATGSAGVATISAHQTEVTINNNFVTDKSLIYITPVGEPSTNTPYLMRQAPQKSFTVGTQLPSVSGVPFNWLIIN